MDTAAASIAVRGAAKENVFLQNIRFYRLRRSPAELQDVKKSSAPWRWCKHSRFDAEFRHAVFWLLVVYVERRAKEEMIIWDDVEHMIRAWSMLRKLEVQLAAEQSLPEHLYIW